MIVTKESVLQQENIYVFGYGSIIWKPDFEYSQRFIAYLSGHERRFWQASVHHRGSVENPGRVVTLNQCPGGKVWGMVYEIRGREKVQAACNDLYIREHQHVGFYDMKMLPVCSKDNGAFEGKPIPAIIYYATPQNPNYKGDEGEEKIAKVIASSYGASGLNMEYLFRLADFMRECLPDEQEPHLYTLDQMVRSNIGVCTRNPLPWTLLVECEQLKQIIAEKSLNSQGINEKDTQTAITVSS